jgi:hypothetical protein
MTLLFGTLEYVMGTQRVVAHPSYDQLMEFCRRAQMDAKDNPADRAFIESTGADLPAWPSKWRFREYEWAGVFREGQLVTVCVYDMLKSRYVRVELDYTLQAYRGMGLASKLHGDLSALWRGAGMRRFKTKAGSLAGVHLQTAMGRTFWGQMPEGELYVDHPLAHGFDPLLGPMLKKGLRLFTGGRGDVIEALRHERFGLDEEQAARLSTRMQIAGAER